MKSCNYISLVTMVVLIIFSSNIYSGNLRWHSFNEGLNKAKKEKKILLIKFYTETCGWCKKMDKTTYKDKKVIDKLNKSFVLVRINPRNSGTIDYHGKKVTYKDFAAKLKVSGYPATGFINNKGRFMGIVGGYKDSKEFLKILSEAERYKN